MNYFHVFWTRPLLKDDQPPASQEIELWDFEALTWLASIMEIRRHSEIRLVTDSRGLSFVRNAGLEWAYNGGISTALDQVPRAVNPQVFWAGGKLFAYEVVEPPCLCLDTDLILWQPFQPTARVAALHIEDNQWPCYRSAQDDFRRHGFADDGWNWSLHPVNTAIAYFRDAELINHYAHTATRFMREYSDASQPQATAAQPRRPVRCDPMVFAEQRLLPMCAERLGHSVALLRPGPPPSGYFYGGPDCIHWWSAKSAYKLCADSRLAVANFLISHLLNHHPASRDTLARWNLAKPLPMEPPPVDEGLSICRSSPAGFKMSLLRNIHGVVWIEDPVSGVRREAREGSMMWSVEIIRPEAGATFEWVVGGDEAVTLRHRS